MTCIVGFSERGTVYMGGDSASVAGWDIRTRRDEKVFRNNGFLIGFCNSFRMGQLLRYSFVPPKQEAGQADMGFMVTAFTDALRECFHKGGHRLNPDGAGCMLVGYKGVLYEIQEDLQIATHNDNMAAIGCGAQVALGALFAARGKPKDRILMSLRAAEAFNNGVRGPFVVRSLSYPPAKNLAA